MTQPNEYLVSHLQNNLLKYAVGHAIFCQTCETVLDVRTAAMTTVHLDGGKELTYVTCGDCAPDDERIAAVLSHPSAISVEILTKAGVVTHPTTTEETK